jgi:hypothetical protein
MSWSRERTPAELRSAYEEGATVEELAFDEGTYPGRIRKLLRDAGTTLRPKGQRVGTQKRNASNAKPPPRTDVPTGTGSLAGHRAVGRSIRRKGII